MTRDPGGFRAQWSGTCPICGEWFEKNTLIVPVHGEAAHIECVKARHE